MSSTKEHNKDCHSQDYRGNLAGFIVQALHALLHLLLATYTIYYLVSTGGEYNAEFAKAGVANVLFKTFHSHWKTGQESAAAGGGGSSPVAAIQYGARAAAVFLLFSIVGDLASFVYCIVGMAMRPFYWQPRAPFINVALICGIVMMSYAWFFGPAATNGIAWWWTVALLVSVGHEVILIMAACNPKYAYVLPWIKSESVPKLVI